MYQLGEAKQAQLARRSANPRDWLQRLNRQGTKSFLIAELMRLYMLDGFWVQSNKSEPLRETLIWKETRSTLGLLSEQPSLWDNGMLRS